MNGRNGISIAAAVVVGAVFLVLWHAVVAINQIPSYLVPGPLLVFEPLLHDWDSNPSSGRGTRYEGIWLIATTACHNTRKTTPTTTGAAMLIQLRPFIDQPPASRPRASPTTVHCATRIPL